MGTTGLPAGFGRFAASRTVRQAVFFAVASASTGLLGGVASALLARRLSTDAFGGYSFATSFFLFTSLFFEFGFFVAAGRMAAVARDDERHELAAAVLGLFVPIGLLFSAVVFGLSFGVDGWFHVHLGTALRLVAVLALVYPFDYCALQLAQGSDRLHAYSAGTLLGHLLFVAACVSLVVTGRISIASALVARSVAFGAGWAVFVVLIRPRWAPVMDTIRRIAHETRVYGFHVYVGRVFSVGTYSMDVLMVAALTDARSVAFYSLAAAIAYPVGLPAAGMATALFPRMATRRSLDRRWLLGVWGLGLTAGIALLSVARPLISLVFSSRYLPVYPLLFPLTAASVMGGVTRLYNSFLTAHGAGRQLWRAGSVLTVSNLVLNVALIPPFGRTGAAWASAGALAVNLAAHVVGYRTVRAEASTGGTVEAMR